MGPNPIAVVVVSRPTHESREFPTCPTRKDAFEMSVTLDGQLVR